MKRGIIILFALMVILSGCNKLSYGAVIKKEYRPAYERTWTSMVQVGKVLVPQIHHEHYAESWNIIIEGHYKDKLKRESYTISEQDFNTISIGDIYQTGN
jgi:mannose-6-phosphate isomerase-like protein (cupin superfamily)